MYTLAGVQNPGHGLGRADETWHFSCRRSSGSAARPGFRLGDHDLAVHVERTGGSPAGQTLSEITADPLRRIRHPATGAAAPDQRLRTR